MTHHRTALIIDDEPDVATYHATLLEDHGWSVRTANDGDEGIRLALDSPPDVVLLDVMMPERGGLSTLVALRKDPSLSDTKVVLVTGVQQTLKASYEAFLERFKTHRPDAYVEKPIEPDKLLGLLDELVSH